MKSNLPKVFTVTDFCVLFKKSLSTPELSISGFVF